MSLDKELISIRCVSCGKEIALVACKEFEVISPSIKNYNFSKANNCYYLGYCEECACTSTDDNVF